MNKQAFTNPGASGRALIAYVMNAVTDETMAVKFFPETGGRIQGRKRRPGVITAVFVIKFFSEKLLWKRGLYRQFCPYGIKLSVKQKRLIG